MFKKFKIYFFRNIQSKMEIDEIDARRARNTPNIPITSASELLRPAIERITSSMSPEGLSAQAQMSRGRWAATQCNTLLALFLLLLCCLIYSFVHTEELQKFVFKLIAKYNITIPIHNSNNVSSSMF